MAGYRRIEEKRLSAQVVEVFEQEIETALALNPNSAYTVGAAGYFHALRGAFERGLPPVDRAIAASPCHPGWFHAAYFHDHLRRRDCDRALQEVESHDITHSIWDPVHRASVLATLGRIDEAKPHVEKLKKLKPDLAFRARELVHRSLKVEENIEEIVDGLCRAGFAVEGP